MIVIAALFVYAIVLGGPVARLLARARWVTRFPQVALRSWHACALGLLASLVAFLLVVAHDLWEHGMVWLFDADEPLVHDAYGGSWLVADIPSAAMLVLYLGAVTLVGLTARGLWKLHRERDRHRLTADTLGAHDRIQDLDVRVLTHQAPAVFCIPGTRAGSRIVVTSAALEMLSETELAAALEHERAHLKFHHHRAFLAADVLTSALGWSGLSRRYAQQVRRLAEMAADDQAARKHGRRAVASALLEMCTAGPVATVSGLPAMTGTDPAERIRRLIKAAPTRAKAMVPALSLTVAVVVLALPVALALAPGALLAGTAHSGC